MSQIPNVCVQCGGIKFNSWIVYKDHMSQMHQKHVATTLKPVNESGRTKAEIVAAVEQEQLQPHLIILQNREWCESYLMEKR